VSNITGWWEVHSGDEDLVVKAPTAWGAVQGLAQVAALRPTDRVTVRAIPPPAGPCRYLDSGERVIYEWEWKVLV
jgi:hypothetical protein